MKLVHLPPAVMGIGMFLVVLSFLWPRIVGTEMVWSEEQARELSEASAEMHRLVHESAHGTTQASQTDRSHGETAGAASPNHEEGEPEALRAARERYRRSEAGLQRAQSLQQGPAAVFKWTGIVLALAGAVGYFVVRSLAE